MTIEQTSNDQKLDSIHIWCIDMDGPVADLANLLSTVEIERAEAKQRAKERDRFILAHGAMRTILGDYLGLPGGELRFVQGEKGKPRVDHPGLTIEFNLSHCENMALLVVSKTAPVGIDLERIRTRPLQLKVAQRMFPEAICKELEQLPLDQLNEAFFKHWTELEARTKCVGDGIFSAEKTLDKITTHHFSPQDGWIACVAAMGIDLSSQEPKHFVYSN